MKPATWIIAGILFVCMVVMPGCVHAQVVAFKSTRLQVFQINYAGEKEKSFSESGAGFGIEAYADWGRSWGRLYTKARGTQVTGRQSFLDGSASTNCDYTYYQGQFETGLMIFPVPARDTGIGIYLAGGGELGYNWLALASSSALSHLKPSESAMSFGYAAAAGVEWTLSKAVGKRKVLTGEITYRVENAALAGQNNFDLGGLGIHVGYGW